MTAAEERMRGRSAVRGGRRQAGRAGRRQQGRRRPT